MYCAIAHRMRGELQIVLQREACRPVKRFRLDIAKSPIVGIGDSNSDLAQSPWFAHVRAAGEHSSIEVRFQPPQPKPGIVFMHRIIRGLKNLRCTFSQGCVGSMW